MSGNDSLGSEGWNEPAPQAEMHDTVAPMKELVMVVDDQELVRLAMASILETAGFEVVAAARLEELAGTGRRPGVLITECALGTGLPGCGDVIRSLRRRYGAGLPAIVLTGERGAPLAVAAPGAKVLRKPVSARALVDAVARRLLPALPSWKMT